MSNATMPRDGISLTELSQEDTARLAEEHTGEYVAWSPRRSILYAFGRTIAELQLTLSDMGIDAEDVRFERILADDEIADPIVSSCDIEAHEAGG